MSANWHAVMIEGEEFPDLIGPFRSEDVAAATAERWNSEHDTKTEGRAWVMPLKQYAEVK